MWRRRQHVGRTLWHNGPSHFSFSHIFSFSVSPSLPPSFLEGADRFRGKWPREPETQGFFYTIEKNRLPFFLFLFLLFHPTQLHEPAGPFRSFIFFVLTKSKVSISFFFFFSFPPFFSQPPSPIFLCREGVENTRFFLRSLSTFLPECAACDRSKAKGKKVRRGDVFFNAAASSSFLPSVPLPVSLFFALVSLK